MGAAAATRRGLTVYVGFLAAVWLVLLTTTFLPVPEFTGPWWPLLVFTIYLAVTEYGDLNFHDEGARLGLSSSEAVFLPMLVALPFEQVLWSVGLAVLAREVRRFFTLKGLFNVAQYSLSAAAAAGIWRAFADSSPDLSATDVAAAVGGVLVFSLLTHFLTSITIALASGGSVIALSRAALPATLTSTAGSIVLGLLFASAYVLNGWTIFLFPLVIGVFFVGYRAMLSQSRERLHVEHLHAATRALVTGGDLAAALLGFLREVQEIASASQARVVLLVNDQTIWSGVSKDDTIADLAPVEDRAMLSLVAQLPDSGALVVRQGEKSAVAAAIGTESFIAVPVRESDAVVGLLMVSHRVGADDFGEADGRLLEALAAELAVSLGAYRLFAEVAEERERFGRIFNSSKEGICLLDLDGVVRAWNPALETMTGYPAAELMGACGRTSCSCAIVTPDRVVADELTGLEPDDELELVTKGGPSRWVSVMSGPVRETDGDGWVVLVRDVSAEHAVEAAKSDFLSTISHELRTPLTTIKGSLQVLGHGREKIPEKLQDQMIEVTTRGAERLERLVMNLLLVSQIESKTMNVFTDELPLDSLVQEKIGTILGSHPRTEVRIPDKPLVVRADHERTGLAVEHLLDNARKFGGPDGEIRVEVFTEAGYGRVSVADDGPGIPPTDQERIFDRFVRLGDVLTCETQGAGVGLFIAKEHDRSDGGPRLGGERGRPGRHVPHRGATRVSGRGSRCGPRCRERRHRCGGGLDPPVKGPTGQAETFADAVTSAPSLSLYHRGCGHRRGRGRGGFTRR